MTGITSSLLGVVCAIFAPRGTVPDAAVGASANVAGGVAPVDASAGTDPVLFFTVTGATGFALRNRRLTMTLRYQPRLTTRIPSPLPFARPLLLHQGDFGWDAELSRRVSWTGEAGVAGGEVDYSVLDLAFPDSVGANTDPVIRLFRGQAETTLGYQAAPRINWDNTLSAAYTVPLDTPAPTPEGEDPEPPAARESTLLRWITAPRYAIDRRNGVGLGIEGSYLTSSLPFRLGVVGAHAMWDHIPRPNQRLAIEAGANYGFDLNGDDALVTPVLTVNHTAEFDAGRTTMSTSAGMRDALDPLLASYRSVIFAGVGVAHRPTADWYLAASVSGTSGALGLSLGPPRRDSGIAMGLPVAYAIRPGVHLDFGVRGSVRLPDARFTGSSDPQVLGLAFVGITTAIAARSGDPMWLWQ